MGCGFVNAYADDAMLGFAQTTHTHTHTHTHLLRPGQRDHYSGQTVGHVKIRKTLGNLLDDTDGLTLEGGTKQPACDLSARWPASLAFC